MKATKVKNFDELYQVGEGSYFFTSDRKTMIAWLPNTKGPSSINLDPLKGERPKWTLSGTDDAPSLTPSLVVAEWHGHLTNGEWTSV